MLKCLRFGLNILGLIRFVLSIWWLTSQLFYDDTLFPIVPTLPFSKEKKKIHITPLYRSLFGPSVGPIIRLLVSASLTFVYHCVFGVPATA